MKKRAIVVGSGIVGIFAALKLEKEYDEVIIIEKSAMNGGLLQSYQSPYNIFFDFGTHIPCETLNKEVDQILFSHLNQDEWHVLDYMKTSNFFEGKLYLDSQFIYTPYLNENDYNKGLVELLNCTNKVSKENNNLQDYLFKTYGETFTKKIYEPLLLKLMNKNILELSPYAFNIFSFSRLIPGNKKLSKKLKEIDVYDEKLSFSSYLEGVSKEKKYYPKNQQGVGLWIDNLLKQCEQKNIKFYNSSHIKKIKCEGSSIKEIILENDKIIPVDVLIWTIAPQIFLDLVQNKDIYIKQEFRRMLIFNFIFDEPFLIDSYYLNCWDKNMKIFRVTLYPNIKPDNFKYNNDKYNCTVEVLVDSDTNISEVQKIVIKELKDMGILKPTSQILFQKVFDIENAFPILTEEVVSNAINLNSTIENKFENILLLGKATMKTFFMNESLIFANKKLNSYLKRQDN